MSEPARLLQEDHALRRSGLVLWMLLLLAGCALSPGNSPPPPPLTRLPVGADAFTSVPRVNGDVGAPQALSAAQVDYGSGRAGSPAGAPP